MEKDRIALTISKDVNELIKMFVETFDTNRSALSEGLFEFGLKNNLTEFVEFWNNGYELKDGRYKDGIVQD